MLPLCLVKIKPVGPAKTDLSSFQVELRTSQPVTESASDLNSLVMQRLGLRVQPLFHVSIGGEQVIIDVSDMLESFMASFMESFRRV